MKSLFEAIYYEPSRVRKSEIDRQTDKETDRQTDRQTDSQKARGIVKKRREKAKIKQMRIKLQTKENETLTF